MKFRILPDRRNPVWLIGASSAWMATAANTPLWTELQHLNLLATPGGLAFACALVLMIGTTLAALLSLLAWRWTLKPALVLLLLAAAFGAYFMATYRVVIDSTMMVNVLQTNPDETADLLSLRMLGMVLLLGVVPAVLVWRTPVHYGSLPRRSLHNLLLLVAALLLLAVTVVAAFQPLASTMRNHKQVRYLMNPLNSVYALGWIAARPLRRDESVTLPIGEDARAAAPGARPPLLVLVLGETARSVNLGLNGYGRDTTPELAREKVASFRNAWSCGTSTAVSVPCMFSHLGREDFEARKTNYESLLDVIHRAGLAVLWLDNQSGCKATCDRVPSVETSNLKHPQLCTGGECLDGIMLEGLEARIAALPAERRARGVVLVMHQMGSHGPAYFKRSPPAFKRFLPECTSNDLQRCSREELVNAYDNSIAYTDHFLASTIRWLRQQSAWDPAMVYVSDHGESLGENNLYLHGLPWAIAPDVQKHVPWVTWLSDGFTQRSGITLQCLQDARDQKISHDHYFHSVLGLLGIQTAVYQPALDAYARCARPPAAR